MKIAILLMVVAATLAVSEAESMADTSNETDPMLGILDHLGLGELHPQFVTHKVGPKEVELLTPEDFGRLGVTALGDIARLRHSCRDYIRGTNAESPVVKAFLALKTKGRDKRGRSKRATCRFYVGWKHHGRLLHPSKGGGQRKIDVDKGSNREELECQLRDLYFPTGISIASGISVEEVEVSMATFSGHRLPDDVNGQPFTAGAYCDAQRCSPIRLYLETKMLLNDNIPRPPVRSTAASATHPPPAAESEQLLDDNIPRPPVRSTAASATHPPPAAESEQLLDDNIPRPPVRSTAASATPPPPAAESEQLLDDNIPRPLVRSTAASATHPPPAAESEQLLDDNIPRPPVRSTAAFATHPPPAAESEQLPDNTLTDDSDFEDALTPTVSFRRRRNLSMRRTQARYTEEQRAPMAMPHTHWADVQDSEDEDLERAIALSAAEYEAQTRDTETPVLKDLLAQMHAAQDSDTTQEVIVSRRRVLDSAFQALRRRFDVNAKLYIKFSGEMGLDHGGPRREFFRLVLQELRASSLFEGTGAKFFAHSLSKLEKGEYQMAGKLVALSLVHEGPGLNCLNPTLASLMLGLDPPLDEFDLGELPNPEVRETLCQLKKIESPQDVDNFLASKGDWMEDQGCRGWGMRANETTDVCCSLVKQTILYRTAAEIAQFTAGMEEVRGMWSMMRKYPHVFLTMLSSTPVVLTKTVFLSLFGEPSYSPNGSNRRSEEDETMYAWEVFLMDVEEKRTEAADSQALSFEELLAFVTGADKVPPCGFESLFQIEFYSNDANSTRLPFSSTCGLSLSLPRGVGNPDELHGLLLRSLRESHGFGKM